MSAIDEMRHAGQLEERIMHLGGEPTTEPADKVPKGQQAEAIFAFDAAVEDETVDVYNQFLQTCRATGDNRSARLFKTIMEEEQEHADHFDNVSTHIKSLGNAYLTKVAGTSASTQASSKGFVNMGSDET